MIQISVNNIIQHLPESSNIEQAIETLEFKDKAMLGVALNQVFIPKDQWSVTFLKDQDQLDILNPVSGG
ncbi:MAG TPA: sulfur carrier protein ThiS [Leucothrix sp.]|nr:sulfur carrier protein ThiS [Leucothrix sp.]